MWRAVPGWRGKRGWGWDGRVRDHASRRVSLVKWGVTGQKRALRAVPGPRFSFRQLLWRARRSRPGNLKGGKLRGGSLH